MKKANSYIKNLNLQTKNWSKKDYILITSIILSFTVITSLTYVFVYVDAWYITALSFLASLGGIFSVILATKRSYFTFILGSFSAVIYGLLSLYWTTYLTAFLQILIVLPINYFAYINWKKNLNIKTKEVEIEKYSNRKLFFWILFGFIITVPLFFIFKLIPSEGGNLNSIVWLDSMNFIFTIIALVFSLKRMYGTWVIWIIVNLISIVMYSIISFNGSFESFNAALLAILTQIIYLVNAFWGLHEWKTKTKEKLSYSGYTFISNTGTKAIYK